jgi:hypothetical protein
MKKLLLGFAFLLVAFGLKAQDCSDIFISQYVEGTGNNKALGIFNPTPNPINLDSNYRLIRYHNGTTAAAGEANDQAQTNLGKHVIPSGVEWVLVIDLVDPNGTGQTAPCDIALQAKADTFLDPDYNSHFSMYFNGNDALSIQKTSDGGATWSYVDIFGMMGDAAMVTGVSWSDQYPWDGSVGNWLTLNHTLIRKHDVKHGVTSNPSPEFIVITEWDSLPVNTFDSLGHHRCDCIGAGINEINKSVSIQLFPNPVKNNHFTINSSEFMQAIEINNVIGQQVLRKETNHSKQFAVETGNIPKGIYSVRIYFSEGKTKTVKLIVQ